MFPSHNPYTPILNWLCATNIIPTVKHPQVAAAMRPFVTTARQHFYNPLGHRMPYHDGNFRAAYLLAYFPYYIEPVYHALAAGNITFVERPNGVMKAAFLGGGPVPEILGLAAYLRDHSPHITAVDATVFDREAGWHKIQQELLPLLAPAYLPASGCLTLRHRPCDVVTCLGSACSCDEVLADIDFVISQNFLTEIYADRERALPTFRNIIRKSRCKAILFIENAYTEVFRFMGELAAGLHAEGLTTQQGAPVRTDTRATFGIPQVLLDNLFTGEDWLIPKRNIKFHRMLLTIQR